MLRVVVNTSQADPPSLGMVVGENVQRIRAERRYTQEEATVRLRAVGLMWSRSGIAALEGGQREDVTVSALLLIATALAVRPADLVDGQGEVQLTGESYVTRQWLRDYLTNGATTDGLSVGRRSRGSGTARLAVGNPAGSGAGDGRPISFKADVELAQRLGLRPEQVYGAAERLWGHSLHEERERRIAQLGDLSLNERRARRGHITRALTAELSPNLTDG